MLLKFSRYLALVYAIGLAIGEAVLNSIQGQWQYAPMWVIDYITVTYLLIGFWMTRLVKCLPILMSAYALSTGVMYMALFVNFDPDLPEPSRGPSVVVALIGLAFLASVVGLVASTVAWRSMERTTPSES